LTEGFAARRTWPAVILGLLCIIETHLTGSTTAPPGLKLSSGSKKSSNSARITERRSLSPVVSRGLVYVQSVDTRSAFVSPHPFERLLQVISRERGA
jgi:hypothetical protein